MRKTIFFYFAIIFLLVSCSSFSGYVKYYTPYVDPHTLPNVVLLSDNEEPKIYSSNNLQSDAIDLESNHYTIIGYSSFNGAEEGQDGIIEICRRTGAKIVLVSVEYTNTQTNSGSISVPNIETTNINGNVYTSSGSSARYNGIATTNSTRQIPYSYNVRRYDQEALYFVPITTKFRLGISWGELTSDIRQKFQRNSGVLVRIVYKGTPAYNANILNGDVIIKIDDTDISNPDEVGSILDKHIRGDEIEITIMRSAQEKKIKVKID